LNCLFILLSFLAGSQSASIFLEGCCSQTVSYSGDSYIVEGEEQKVNSSFSWPLPPVQLCLWFLQTLDFSLSSWKIVSVIRFSVRGGCANSTEP
jgi:hypothetical protein